MKNLRALWAATSKKQRLCVLGGAGAAVLALAVFLFCFLAVPAMQYSAALRLLEEQDAQAAYDKSLAIRDGYGDVETLRQYLQAAAQLETEPAAAKAAFSALGDYRDSRAYWGRACYALGLQLRQAGDFEAALAEFAQSGQADADEQCAQTAYTYAQALAAQAQYEAAAAQLAAYTDYRDAAALRLTYLRTAATAAEEAGDLPGAIALLEQVNQAGGQEDSVTQERRLWSLLAQQYAEEKDWAQAEEAAKNAVDYPSEEEAAALVEQYQNEAAYEAALALYEAEDYAGAMEAFDALGDFRDSEDYSADCEQALYHWTFDGFLSTDGTADTQTTTFSPDDRIYCTGTLSGGKPGRTVDLVFRWKDHQNKTSTCTIESWVNNTNGGCYFTYSHPKNVTTSGESTITVSIKSTGEVIATYTFDIDA